MKKITSLSILLSMVVLPLLAGPINYRNKEMTLISFSVSIHSDAKKCLDGFESSFPDTKNTNADKVIAKIKEQSWGSISDILQREVGMVILPISTFGNKITYDSYGFPEVNISKAQRKGFSKYYMKIDLQIGPESILLPLGYRPKKDSTYQNTKPTVGEIRPVVVITITTFPANGVIPLGKYIGVAEAKSNWSIEDASKLDGLVNDKVKTDLSNFMSLINEAINDVSINMLVQ